ncbi:MAG: choice-of-anchor J domain-containing protein, partial [Candidatus Cloacimonetes bacterium]|nr:choice-of-anchor J domain-containing protein [Candidatus Cloacimonadota bacterium]
TNYALNTTHLIVLKYTFNAGATNNDAVYMFVNPELGGAEPTPTVSITTDTATDATSIVGVGLRQYNTGQLARFDGIRVGTTWADIAGAAAGNQPPVITGVTLNPNADITSTTTVSVSADVTDDDTVAAVELQWGLAADNLSSSIGMSLAKGEYVTDSSIPAQADGTTVFYRVYAEDNEEEYSYSSILSYTVQDPATTAVPYLEDFATGFGDCYTYSVAGNAKFWSYSSSGGYVYANGYGSGVTEEDWLVLPGIDFDAYGELILSFDSWYNYGTDDENNYLKLMYSTDYAGIGSPALATWTEIPFAQPIATQTWTTSGLLDLAGINGSSVWLALKYHYTDGNYRSWQVDNFSILEAATPMLDAAPAALEGFTYEVGSGPSAEQNFVVSGQNLTSNVTVTAPASFEISESSGAGFSGEIILNPAKADLVNTTIYVRLKAGLDVGNYLNEEITITATSAIGKVVTCSGTVSALPPEPGYLVDFEDGTKGSYDPGTVNLNGLDWDMTQAVIGNLANDWKNGLKSARMRGHGTSAITMLQDKADGAGTVSFSYRRYGTDTQVDWKVEYSTDGGSIWTQLGAAFTAPASDIVSTFNETLNVSGNVRIRIKRATESGSDNKRLNIDDINISHYTVVEPGVPVVISGVEVEADIALSYDNTLSVDDIPALPNSASLVDPVVIVFTADGGETDITLNLGAGTWYAVIYYNGSWHQGSPYPLDGPGQVVFEDVSFGAKGNVYVVVSENEDPTLPVELSHFAATMTAEQFVALTWTTQTETDCQGYYVYRSLDQNISSAVKVSTLINATNTSQAHTYSFVDTEIAQSGTYYYWLQSLDLDGSVSFAGPVSVLASDIPAGNDVPGIGLKTEIYSVYPNPFNPNAYIGYSLEKDSKVQIAVYNMRGQLVRNLMSANKSSGYHRIEWNGRDNGGAVCGTGIYYIKMLMDGKTFTRKAMMMK